MSPNNHMQRAGTHEVPGRRRPSRVFDFVLCACVLECTRTASELEPLNSGVGRLPRKERADARTHGPGAVVIDRPRHAPAIPIAPGMPNLQDARQYLLVFTQMRMPVSACLVAASLLVGCSYDGIRMHERSRCAAMPQSQAQACYGRTQDTKAEYDSKLRALKDSANKSEEKPVDERYENWIP